MIDLITLNAWTESHVLFVLLILAGILIIKGCALYRAARKESVVWFWVLLAFNTLGILPLLYLIFSKKAD